MRACLRVDARAAALTPIEEWVARFCAEADLAPEIGARLLIVIEEAVTNVSKNNVFPVPIIDLALERDENAVELIVEDTGGAFDPTAAPAPDFAACFEAHTAGGLGIHMMRSLMDDVRYERTPQSNRLTLRKALGPPQT